MIGKKVKRIRRPLSLIALIILVLTIGALFFPPDFNLSVHRVWRNLGELGERIFGIGRRGIPVEERRIREEIILKKMEEANAQQDWRLFAPEYPKLKKTEGVSEEERVRSFRNTPEFKEIEKEWERYVKKKEESLLPEGPLPSMKEGIDELLLKDKGEEKIIERLLTKKGKVSSEPPLEENLRLGIKGPLVSRKILVRPPPPSVDVKLEGEVEVTLWVRPDGTVDRVIPSIKIDSELERIAIQYLKRWRFAPLSKDQEQVEQWGSIPIKFKLQ